ncbi:MAG: inositol monophosphatase family protein, partial [Pseudomonadota bacterium]
GRLFWTPEPGAALEERAADGAPIPVEAPGETRALRTAPPDNAALRVVASKSHRDAETDAFIARFRVADLLSAGSSLKFCLVASGEADLYPRFGPTMEWDTAAADAVLRAAGGRVDRADAVGGADGALRYGKADLRNPAFVAYAAGVAVAGEGA